MILIVFLPTEKAYSFLADKRYIDQKTSTLKKCRPWLCLYHWRHPHDIPGVRGELRDSCNLFMPWRIIFRSSVTVNCIVGGQCVIMS